MYRARHHKEMNQKEKHKHNNHHQQHRSLLGSVFRRKGHHSSNMPSSSTSAPTPLSFTEATTTSSNVSEETNNTDPHDLPRIALPDISVVRAIAQSSIGDDLSTTKAKSKLISSSHEMRRMYSSHENLEVLENGGCLFAFVCHHAVTPYEADMVNSIINVSGFENEEKENFVPHFEYENYRRKLQEQEQRAMDKSSSSALSQPSQPKYTFLLARCGYLLTAFDLQELLDNPQIITSLEYQKACQPEGTKIWDDTSKMDADNFRITKPIIPYIYSFTIQFRVSRMTDDKELQRLSQHLHIPIHGAIVLERTKRSVPPKDDATRKCKSVLAYTDMGSGVVLVSHLTVILQAGLPEIIERILGTIGQWGLGETAETAWRTRRYLQAQLPYVPVLKEQAFFMDAASELENQTTISEPDTSSDDEDHFFDAVDDVAQDLSSGVANLAVH
jgi:hypothetical protein